MKILYGYPWFESKTYGNVQQVEMAYISRLQTAGYDIEGFCLSYTPPSSALIFAELDKLWKKKDRKLLLLYDDLLRRLEGFDVLINAAGINLHPEFVETLPVLTVFGCNDDPESSSILSQPVASAYDLCLVGNIAEVESYKSWGAKRAIWHPLGLRQEILPPKLTFDEILYADRSIDIFMMAERESPWRKKRFDVLESAFPNAYFFGRGWKRGLLPQGDEATWLRNTRIGPNLHNSTGPINFRTFYLPANGVMQICDNKRYLAEIFKLGEEVVGFDTIDECVDLCKYYLAHEDERRAIAANGWLRVMRDYTEEKVFERAYHTIETIFESEKKQVRQKMPIVIFNNNTARCVAKVTEKLEEQSKKILKIIFKRLFPRFYEHVKKKYFSYKVKKSRAESVPPVGPNGIRIICYEDVSGWILGKFAQKICKVLVSSGRHANIAKYGDPTASIGHHIIYYDAQKKWAPVETFMITHIDTDEKIKKVRRQLEVYDMGICMSSDTREKLVALGMPAGKLCYVNPAHDGVTRPRPIVLGIASKTHADGRKNENALVSALQQLPKGTFTLKIMGMGWESQVTQLKKFNFSVEYYPAFDYSIYTKDFMPSLDYFLYFSNDEGSMAILDAIAADVKTIVTPQGYHLDIKNGIDYAVRDAGDIATILQRIHAEREERLSRITGWTWEEYTWRHEVIWDYLLTGKKTAFIQERLSFLSTIRQSSQDIFAANTPQQKLFEVHEEAKKMNFNQVATQLLRQCLIFYPQNSDARRLLR